MAGDLQDPVYVEEVEDAIASAGLANRVRLLGHTDDVPGFLAAVDVLVVPSSGTEGQPTAILEALACGRPVVVRRPVWSRDFEGLPVVAYDRREELAAALQRLPAAAAQHDELRRRFGPEQVLAALVGTPHAA